MYRFLKGVSGQTIKGATRVQSEVKIISIRPSNRKGDPNTFQSIQFQDISERAKKKSSKNLASSSQQEVMKIKDKEQGLSKLLLETL